MLLLLLAALLAMLARLTCAKKAIEIGVFTGAASLGIASVLAERGGRLVGCELEPKWPAVGKPFWQAAGVEEIIDLRIGLAAETIDHLLCAGEAGTFDLGFIDANKNSYDIYYEGVLELLRPGGVVVVDNVLFGGRVLSVMNGQDGRGIGAAPRKDRFAKMTSSVHTLNQKIHADKRVDICVRASTIPMLP